MGCFLLITEKDFGQLSSTAKAGASKLPSNESGKVKIEVSPTAFRSAKEMANIIRSQVPNAQTTSASAREQKRAIPTPERYQAVVSTLAATTQLPVSLCKNLVDNQLNRTFGAVRYDSGKAGEQVAAKVLEQHQHLTIHEITKAQGPDIVASGRGGNRVIVEVKTSTSNKSFSDMLGQGYGHRQCSDGWMEALKIDPSRTEVMGVHIDPIKETVTLYRRVDAEATTWKPLMHAPLSQFKLD